MRDFLVVNLRKFCSYQNLPKNGDIVRKIKLTLSNVQGAVGDSDKCYAEKIGCRRKLERFRNNF